MTPHAPPRIRPFVRLAGLAALVCVGATSTAGQDPGTAPPSRALLLELTSQARLAGTSGSERAAEMVARVLDEAGWDVEIDEREVLLSLPRRLAIAFKDSSAAAAPFHERIERFDPDAVPPGDVPPFNSWSASGEAVGEVVDAGHGTREDFEQLVAARIALAGKIALCRYGGGYRGVKVALATEFGCAGVLLFNDPADDGAERGEVWPRGPWKPDWEAQRGSIAPMGRSPGDPSTPGFPSPAPGRRPERARLAGAELDAALPRIPCLPIGAAEAALLIERLTARRVTNEDGTRATVRVGPGPVVARVEVDAPRTIRTIRNVIGRLAGQSGGPTRSADLTGSADPRGSTGPNERFVLAGNHRDAWVRGAHDAGGGTVALLRAAQHLGARAKDGWVPRAGLALAFWDAEEHGLLGSTEWAEAHADELRAHLLAYVNADTAVSGTRFRASGTPGLEAVLARALQRVQEPPAPGADAALFGRTLYDQWLESSEGTPRLGLPGSGSDFAVFLHHLALPVLDFSFSGNSGGQYHTAFDDFLLVDRYLDPGFGGHEAAGRFVAELLVEIADAGRLALDDARAAAELERHALETAEWLGEERAKRLATAFRSLSRAAQLSWVAWRKTVDFEGSGALGPLGEWPAFLDELYAEPNASARRSVWDDPALPEPIYAALAGDEGLPGRPWYRHELWTPGLETGYGSETFPRLRAALDDEERLARELDALTARIGALRGAWDERREGLRAGK